MAKKTKTEHSGAKNGGGFWGSREEAKTISKSLRRSNDKEEVKEQLDGFEDDKESKKSISKEAQILVQKGLEASRRCGGRSAYSRDGGAEPISYKNQISKDYVIKFRKRLK